MVGSDYYILPQFSLLVLKLYEFFSWTGNLFLLNYLTVYIFIIFLHAFISIVKE